MATVEDDLIHRSAVIDGLNEGAELLKHVLKETGIIGTERVKYEFGLGLIEACVADAKEIPPVQTKRAEGKWIFVHPIQSDDPGAYMCSKCKTGMWEIKPPQYHYCPNCGEKMEGVLVENDTKQNSE